MQEKDFIVKLTRGAIHNTEIRIQGKTLFSKLYQTART